MFVARLRNLPRRAARLFVEGHEEAVGEANQHWAGGDKTVHFHVATSTRLSSAMTCDTFATESVGRPVAIFSAPLRSRYTTRYRSTP